MSVRDRSIALVVRCDKILSVKTRRLGGYIENWKKVAL